MNTHEGYSKKKLSNDNVLLAGGGEKSLADFLGGIRISSSKIQYKAADSAADWTDLITLVNTDENVKQTPKTDNANRPLMMINGGTSVGELISTSLFSTGIYANASTKMITANGFVKTGSDSSHVLLGDGGHKAWGNANGDISVNNGTVCTNLNADLLDGYHAKEFTRALYNSHTNPNALADSGDTLAMISLADNGNVDNPGGKTGWHHFVNITWTDTSYYNGTTNNEWCTQIANACGSTDLWVRSRSGGSISNGTAWGANWTRILTGSNWTNVITLPTVNNASLTLQTAGTTLTTFYANDSTNRTFNVTCASIGAEPAHSHPYIRVYSSLDIDPSDYLGYWAAMTTKSGISSNYCHILHMDWAGGANWRSEIAIPTLGRTGVYYRSDGSGWAWTDWIGLLDTSSTNLTKTGNLTCANFYTTSDRNKKTNISLFSEHIRKFQLKDTEKWHYGVIAQEVEEMFRDGEEGNMTVNYNSILSFYIGQLENRVKMLEERIKRLESK